MLKTSLSLFQIREKFLIKMVEAEPHDTEKVSKQKKTVTLHLKNTGHESQNHILVFFSGELIR